LGWGVWGWRFSGGFEGLMVLRKKKKKQKEQKTSKGTRGKKQLAPMAGRRGGEEVEGEKPNSIQRLSEATLTKGG